ncbi:MAG: TonB-dependent receptor plug domain-containing protein [Rikenellaceae bacterium]|nr:TonB-dependent receptor plug domain-containing protein [Rikenellaceae bacterium]
MKKSILLCASLLCFGAATAQKHNVSGDIDSAATYSVGLDEVKVLASYGHSQGHEPVVLSTVGSGQIATKLSNQEFPEILKSTPSVYATKQGGGFGDSRLVLRGFGSENIALLINGVPMNGMENGSIYWSNWAGLADVTNSIQVQRGVGLSKLGLFSVGGTVNIITRSADLARQGTVYYGIGNDGYRKAGFVVSSGMTPKGWAFTIMGTRTAGDGYVNGTNFEAWGYFANISKKIGTRHLLSLTAFGAPQWHNRRSNRQLIEDYESNRDGIRMNTAYGYINGKVVGTYSGYNEYHKPQISLNHFWSITGRSNLSTVAYVSNAKGGGRKVYGKDANRLQYNYKTGRPNPNSSLTPDGLIDYGPVMEDNRNSDHGSDAIFTMGTNAHDWYGLLSSYVNEFTERIKLTVGIDTRYYKGYHYDEISDLLGGAYYKDNKLAWRDPDAELHVGDRVSQDYESKILWAGGFAQAEYKTDRYKAFISASVTSHSYRRRDPGRYGAFGDQDKYPASQVQTRWRNFVPFSVKGGFNYRFGGMHNVFVNGGYVTRAPMMDNIYVDNTPISDPVTEKIGTAEIGYSLNSDKVHLTLNAYWTKWMDKSVTKAIGAWNGPKACIPDIDARHEGVELEVSYMPVPILRLYGFFTIGNWRWTNDVSYTLLDADRNKVGEYHAYIKGLHVGNAPQTSAMLGVSWMPMRKLTVGADWNYYARHYADFAAADRNDPDDRADAWKLPDYSTFDLNLSYGFKMGSLEAQLIGNVNNVFNTKYISDAQDGADHLRESAMVWYGFGTTWTAGLKILF